MRSSFGRAVCLALFSVSLATCGAAPGASSGAKVDQSSVEGPQSRAFYKARGWAAAWDDDAAGQLQEALANAPEHGLKAEMFLPSPLPEDEAAREPALTKAALLYASALASGFVDPKSLGNIYTIPRPKPDLAAGLNQALANDDVATWLASLAPQTEEYRALSTAYLQFRRLAAKTRTSAIPEGGLIRPGSRDPRIPAIAEALVANGYLEAPPGEPQNPPRYQPALVEAVKKLQADYGMKPDEVIARLSPLAQPGKPFFGTAGEMTGMAMLAKGDRMGAGRLFAQIAGDKQVPQTIRSRAVQFAGSLGVDASASMPADPAAPPAL